MNNSKPEYPIRAGVERGPYCKKKMIEFVIKKVLCLC